ncbi:MAG: aryl-sulfate sulfotransferase [Beijerinckiaceae bacterium]
MDNETLPIRLAKCDAARREPGTIYFTTRPGGLPTRAAVAWIVGVDQDGSISLNRKYAGTSQDIRCLPGGTVLFSQSAQGLIHELDRKGDILRTWHARGKYGGKAPPSGSTELPVNFIHHTVNVMPDGNFLLLDASARIFGNWHSSTSDASAPKQTAEVVGDIVTEVTRDGKIVQRYNLLDMLDPFRATQSTRSGYWRKQGFPNGYDWSHCNAVTHDPADDTLVVSLRHQDAIVKFRRGSGELVWILGNHSQWKEPWSRFLLKPDPGLSWQFHQHDCSIPAPGRVMCFDNGNYRTGAFETPMPDSENRSRLVEFEVDAAAMTVRQAWAWDGAPSEKIYACYQGGAMRLPKTGNVFGTFGGICLQDGIPTSQNEGTFGRARLIEVTPEGEIVFDLHIDDSTATQPRAFSAFRATHAPF